VDDLKQHDVTLSFAFDEHLHDRQIRMDNGWTIKIGRGFDIYQRIDRPRSGLGMNDFDLRPCWRRPWTFSERNEDPGEMP